MEKTVYRFYKTPNNEWLVDLPGYPGSISDLQMVVHADDMLELFSKGEKEVKLEVSLEYFLDAEVLEYIRPCHVFGGAYYFMESFNSDIVCISMWLCPVMNYIFGEELPKNIYVKKAI